MRLLAITLLVFIVVSCRKIEGPGGTSTIQGKIIMQEYDAFNQLIAEYDAADERVFILYGTDDNTYDDDFRTSYDGSYRFDYLTKGSYRIFVYSDCNTCESGNETIIVDVSITENKSTIILPDIIIRK